MRLVLNYNRNIIHIRESQFSADPKIMSEEIISTLLPSVASEVTQAALIPRVFRLPICYLIIASRCGNNNSSGTSECNRCLNRLWSSPVILGTVKCGLVASYFDSRSLKLDHDTESNHFGSLSSRQLALKRSASF